MDLETNKKMVNELCASKDLSTYWLGNFFKILKERGQQGELLFHYLVDYAKNFVQYDSENKLKYIGNKIDYYQASIMAIITDASLAKTVNLDKTLKYLISVINGTRNNDEEFAIIYAILQSYTSNQPILNRVLNVMMNYYNSGRQIETLHNMRKLAISVIWSQLKFLPSNGNSCYDYANKTIYIDNFNNSELVIMHELGHAFDNIFGKRNKLSSHSEILEKAKQHALSNPKFKEFLKAEVNKGQNIKKMSEILVETAAIDKVENIIKSIVKSGKINELCDIYKIPNHLRENFINSIKTGKLDTKTIAKTTISHVVSKLSQKNACLQPSSYVGDIITAVFRNSKIKFSDDEIINLEFGHSETYYYCSPDRSFEEIMANVYALRISGQEEYINLIKEFFGQEFYNFIMEEYNNGIIIENNQENSYRRAA